MKKEKFMFQVKCHNYDRATELKRCPLVTVCDDDCPFVWKSYYDNRDEVTATEQELRVCLDDANSLANEFEHELDELKDEYEDICRNYQMLIDGNQHFFFLLSKILTTQQYDELKEQLTNSDIHSFIQTSFFEIWNKQHGQL